MTGLFCLIKRNTKLFFKDKGMFLTSLITPLILLVLYVTFLGKVYKDTFAAVIPEGLLGEDFINGLAGGQLVSSLLAVSCVTVAFCSNLIMVQDKITGAKSDLTMAPIKSSTLSMSYFFSTALVTLIVCTVTYAVCLIYLAIVGWFMSFADVLLLFLDMILLVLFGTALASLVNAPLSTQGQGSAVGTIISAGYGFICGAYMPISNFGATLQNILAFFPGTYGTSLIRNHALKGVLSEMLQKGVPTEVITEIRNSIDCNLYFFQNQVSVSTMYLIISASAAVLIGAFVLVNMLKRKTK